MEDKLHTTFDFEFGIVSDQLDLSDDEDLSSQVSMQASKLELQRQQENNFTVWREDLIGEFEDFLKELIRELQPRQDDHEARMNIVDRLSSALVEMSNFRGATLSTFGSFESNSYTQWSDLDLSLELPDRNTLLEPISKKLKVRVLNSLQKTLIRKGEAHNLQFIPYARVPLITFEDSCHNISCDISVDNDAAILKSKFLRWIGEIDSRCRDLIFLVKCWAKAHDINDPKLGTLNSFALCLLVIFHLQTRSPPLLPPLSALLDEDIARRLKGSQNSIEEALRSSREKIQPFIANQFGTQNKSSVAELFFTFFNQFSAVKDLWKQGLAICTFTGAWGDKSSTCAKWRTKRYMMRIEDPFDRWENCARSVQESTYDFIIKAFTSTANTLQCPAPNISLSHLLEALFLWPVDAQALGRQAWLAKVHSKIGKRKPVSWNMNFTKKSTTYRKVRSKAQAVQDNGYHRSSRREVSLDLFLEKSLEAQSRERLQFEEFGTPVKQKKKKKQPPVSSKAIAVVDGGKPGSNLAHSSVHLARIDNRAQAIETHLHQLLNISHDSLLENNVEDLANQRPLANDSVITGVSRRMKKKNWGGVPSMSPMPGNSAQHNLLCENTVREDEKAQGAEHNAHHPHTDQTLYIEGVTRTQKSQALKYPQKGSWPALEHGSKPWSVSESYLNDEAQLQGHLWPAMESCSRHSPGTSSTGYSTMQVQNPFVERESYASAMKNGEKQRRRFNQGGSGPRNDNTGVTPRNYNGKPGWTGPAAKPVGDIPGRASRPAAANKFNHSRRQGEARLQAAQQQHSQGAKVWTPRNASENYTKFSLVREGPRNTAVAIGESSIGNVERLPRHHNSTD